MGVVTVIGAEGVQVLVEFVGGPRDSKRSFAVATTDFEGKPIPPTGFGSGQLAGDPVDSADLAGGSYVREGLTSDGEAYNYVWRTAPAPAPAAVPGPDAPPPDLATRIRLAYARRAPSDAEHPDVPQRRLTPGSPASDRGEA